MMVVKQQGDLNNTGNYNLAPSIDITWCFTRILHGKVMQQKTSNNNNKLPKDGLKKHGLDVGKHIKSDSPKHVTCQNNRFRKQVGSAKVSPHCTRPRSHNHPLPGTWWTWGYFHDSSYIVYFVICNHRPTTKKKTFFWICFFYPKKTFNSENLRNKKTATSTWIARSATFLPIWPQ